MKHHIVSLLVTILGCIVSGCDEKYADFCIKKSPVSALIDGTQYSSETYKHMHGIQQETRFKQKGVLGFYFSTEREIISADNDTIVVEIYLDEDAVFSTGVKYPLPKDGDGRFRHGNIAYMIEKEIGMDNYGCQIIGYDIFRSIDGWVEFTKYEEKEDGIYFSGKFEYTVDRHNNAVSKITQGTFDNIIANY